MIRTSVAAILSFLGCFAQVTSTPSPAVDPWQPFRFLIGTWEAKTQGGSAGAASVGTYAFQLELGNHVLARHSSNASCKGPADFNCDHGDLLYIYRASPDLPLKAIYFDNEGRAIHYDVTTPAPNVAILLSAPSQEGPQYRLIYELKGEVMLGKFQLRMPGQSDFRSYLEWAGGRK